MLLLTLIASINLSAQVGVNADGSTPDSSAMLDVKSTSRGLLPPRMTANQRDDINNPAAGLIIYCIDCVQMQMFNGTAWTDMIGMPATGPAGSYPSGTVNCLAGGADIVDVTNPTTGVVWMDRNMGAAQVATSSGDTDSYGDLYQWGRFSDGHQCRTSDITSTNATTAIPNSGNAWDGFFITESTPPSDWLTPYDDNLWQGVSGTNNPCPNGYRLPTEAEWNDERLSWSSNDAAGAFASPLKLPVAGGRNNINGSLVGVGFDGYYWSSTVSIIGSRNLFFLSDSAEMNSIVRASGLSVRCLKDGATEIPDVTNPSTGEIWMDRNLGASQVATSSTDTFSYGDLYQWGRAADGHESRTSLTTDLNATTAVPNDGNPWDGLFITESNPPRDWLTPQDDNLWQGASGTNNPCPSGYRLPTEAEWNDERLSWSSNDAAGAFGSALRLPAAGGRNRFDGSLINVGSEGGYWSSTVNATDSRQLFFSGVSAGWISEDRAYGYSVRCIKD